MAIFQGYCLVLLASKPCPTGGATKPDMPVYGHPDVTMACEPFLGSKASLWRVTVEGRKKSEVE